MTRAAGAGTPAPRGWTDARGGIGVFLAAGVLTAILNAAVRRLAGTRIGADDLGAFDALSVVLGGVGLFGLGLQVVVVRHGTPRLAVGRVAAVLATVCCASGAAVLPGPTWYGTSVGACVGIGVAAVLLGVPHRARLLADASWRRLAASYVAGATVRLLTFAALLGVVDNELLAALAATVAGEAATSAVAYALAAPQYRGAWSAAPARVDAATARGLLRGAAVLLGLWGLTVVDAVLARARLSASDADGYAAAATVARASFFFAVLLAHLALPTFMDERGRSAGLRRAFATVTGLTGAGAASIAAVVLAAPTWSADLLLGDSAASVDVPTLRWLVVAWAALALVPVLTYFHLARHPRLALVPAAGAVVLALAGTAVSTSRSLAVATAVTALVVVGVTGLPAVQRLRPITRARTWDEHDAAPADAGDVALVVPFLDPGPAVVVDTVQRLASTLAAAGMRHQIVAVSDGSTDGSAEALRRAAIPGVEVIELERNGGKGAALRAGLVRCRATLVGYIDADGDLPPEQVVHLVGIATATAADAVVASKLHPDSMLAVERHRQLMSAVFRWLVRLLFRLDVRDTQTGLKLYRGDVMADVAPLLREDGFAIDVELLVAVVRAGRASIVEAPVHIVRGGGSTISVRRAVATVAGLVRIYWRDHVALGYDPAAGAPATVAAS